MDELIKLLQGFAQDIDTLKQWKAEQDQRQKEVEAEAERTQEEFNKFITERKEAEAERAADAAKLRELMM